MEFEITSNTDNKLLKRKEIKFHVSQDASTISREEITREICKKLSLNPESTIVVRIDQGFGSKESSGIAHSYENKDLLNKYEPKHVLSKVKKKPESEGAAKDTAVATPAEGK
jgi:small subunit ribosomal protein S24e